MAGEGRQVEGEVAAERVEKLDMERVVVSVVLHLSLEDVGGDLAFGGEGTARGEADHEEGDRVDDEEDRDGLEQSTGDEAEQGGRVESWEL